jgi:hypothetical protein
MRMTYDETHDVVPLKTITVLESDEQHHQQYHPIGFVWPKDFKPRYRVKALSRKMENNNA